MPRLDWGEFDGNKFQKFCNSLLLFEVSKFAHVFSAAGKDGGTDQLYHGTYDNRNGKWRFQDKFHNSGNKRNDIASLKQDIKKDILTNWKGETFIVVITNVNLTTGKYKELVSFGESIIRNAGIEDCEILIWHEPNIEAFVANNPLIFNWFWQQDQLLLKPYDVYFDKELVSDNEDLRYQLHNEFVGRNEDLEFLNEFVKNDEHTTLALMANGGYGKTRLCVQFFKTALSQLEEWHPLVLYHTCYQGSSFDRLLKMKGRLIILIDNAHEIPEIVSDVKRLIEAHKGRHKLIITTRNTLFSEIFMRIPNRNRDIVIKKLDKLNHLETKELIKKQLDYLRERDIIRLAEMAKGVPLVVLEFIRLIRNGKQPYEISAEDSFSLSVFEIINQVACDIDQRIHIAKEKTLDYLRIISLISPITDQEHGMKYISELLGLNVNKAHELTHELAELGIISKGNLSIKPDPYSDTLVVQLINRNKHFIENVLRQDVTGNYIENVLKNLAQAESTKEESSSFIEDLIRNHVNLINSETTTIEKIKSIYEFVERISIVRPQFAILAIRKFLILCENKTHPIHLKTEPWSSKKYTDIISDTVRQVFVNILTNTDYGLDHIAEISHLVEDFVSVTRKFEVIKGGYSFREYDFNAYGFRPRQCCERQLFLKDKVLRYLETSSNPFQIEFAIEAAKVLLELSFESESYYEKATSKIHFGRFHIPGCQHTKDIRKSIISSLIHFQKNKNATEEIRDVIFEELIKYIAYCSESVQSKVGYDFEEGEVFIVLNFLYEYMCLADSLSEKARVIERIGILERSDIKSPYLSKIDEIKAIASKTGTLYEEFVLILLDKHADLEDNKLEFQVAQLIGKYNSFLEFGDDLIKSNLLLTEWNRLSEVINFISKKFKLELKILLDRIFTDFPTLVQDFKVLIRANYEDKNYFYSIIERLDKSKDQNISSIIWALTYGRERNKHEYSVDDLIHFDYVIQNKIESVYELIIYTLGDYIEIAPGRVLNLFSNLLRNANKRCRDSLFMVLFNDKNEVLKTHKDAFKSWVFGGYQHIDINDYYSLSIFVFLDQEFGFDTLFDFISQIFAYQEHRDEFRYWDSRIGRYKNSSLNEEEKYQRFSKVLQWFLEVYNGEESNYIKTLRFFHPVDEFDETLMRNLLTLVELNKTDIRILKNITKALGTFFPTTVPHIVTISKAIEACILSTSEPLNIYSLFGSNFHHVPGGKSKSGIGIPFPQDVQKRDMLSKVLKENKFIHEVRLFLEGCLKETQREIDEEIERDKHYIES